ncbi:MAG: glycosyltransferase family 4 protein [Desulfobacteraceae bacterium]|nr:glycosyltransferase family 4 protein [Desulfobacteraceae bacterium]
MRILVISDVPWSDDNSVGNTYSNIFKNMKDVEFANLYCQSGTPTSELVKEYYQITEKDIIKNLFKKKSRRNNKTVEGNLSITFNKKEQKLYDILRSLRFQSFLLIREFIWKIGKWQTRELNNFIKNFNPDIIFTFCLESVYYINIVEYCKEISGAKLVQFFTDDVYSFKSQNPSYLIHKSCIRKTIRRSITKTDLTYGATRKLCEEYSRFLHTNIFPLYKICDTHKNTKTTFNNPLKITYTGNLFYGRWRVLALLAQAIKEINENGLKIVLNIYTTGLFSNRIQNALNVKGASMLLGGISYSEVKKVLSESDMVAHVESFENREIRKTHLSFSTKIVDCIQSGNCLLAIGPEKVESINLLNEHNIAQVILKNSKEEIKKKLTKILEQKKILTKTAERMREYGVNNHSEESLKCNLYNRLKAISKGAN